MDRDLIEKVRAHIATLTDEERWWFFDAMAEGYCTGCYQPGQQGSCPCQNEE